MGRRSATCCVLWNETTRRCRGWVLDERGLIRRHINVYVNGELGGKDTAVAQSRSGRGAAGDFWRVVAVTELILGTKKGLFVVDGSARVRALR